MRIAVTGAAGKAGTEVVRDIAADTVMDRPSRELVQEVYPTTEIRDLPGRATCLSIEKARRLLGYEPQHSWKMYV